MLIAQCHAEVVREQRITRAYGRLQYWLEQILSIDHALPDKDQGKLRTFYVNAAHEAYLGFAKVRDKF